jgi:hypothetical protein
MLPLSSFLDVLREYAKCAYPDHVSFIVLSEECYQQRGEPARAMATAQPLCLAGQSVAFARCAGTGLPWSRS